jgi:predicted transcriptional regulator
MADQDPPPRVDSDWVAEIVSSYVRHHQVAADQLAGRIVEVHRALASLGRATPVPEPAKPAVPNRRSVQRDYVVCLECGFRAKLLRGHCGSRTASMSPLTAPAGDCRRTIH